MDLGSSLEENRASLDGIGLPGLPVRGSIEVSCHRGRRRKWDKMRPVREATARSRRQGRVARERPPTPTFRARSKCSSSGGHHSCRARRDSEAKICARKGGRAGGRHPFRNYDARRWPIPPESICLGSETPGDVILPGDGSWIGAPGLEPGFRPEAVAVFCRSPPTTSPRPVRFAAENDLRIAFNAGAHAGPIDWRTDTLLLKTEQMRGVEIDTQSRRARVDAGVLGKPLAKVARTASPTCSGRCEGAGVISEP